MIVNVRESDHGSYQCRAENEIESLDAVVELIVQGKFEEANCCKRLTCRRAKISRLTRFPVPPKFVKKPEDKVASERQDLEFECEIYGKPEPKIAWFKNGERITLSEYWQIVNGYVYLKETCTFCKTS